jgi:hypothetical protein
VVTTRQAAIELKRYGWSHPGYEWLLQEYARFYKGNEDGATLDMSGYYKRPSALKTARADGATLDMSGYFLNSQGIIFYV